MAEPDEGIDGHHQEQSELGNDATPQLGMDETDEWEDDSHQHEHEQEQEQDQEHRPETLPLSHTNIPLLCCAFLASITTGGTLYAFGLYGNELKKKLDLSEGQLDTISTAIFCAGLLSWAPGLLVDRFGTRFGISVGGVFGAAALMCFYAISAKGMFIAQDEKQLIVAALSALGVATFLGCALVTGAVFKIVVQSCGPGTKGDAVGIAKGYVGLGSGVYACLFEAIRSPGSSDLDFIPMAATLFIVVATIPSLLFLPPHEKQSLQSGHVALAPSSFTARKDVASRLHLRVLYASLIMLATIVLGTSIITLYEERRKENEDKQHGTHRWRLLDVEGTWSNEDDQEDTQNFVLAGFIVMVWILPIASLVFLPQARHRAESNSNNSSEGDAEQDALLDESEQQQLTCLQESGDARNAGVTSESATKSASQTGGMNSTIDSTFEDEFDATTLLQGKDSQNPLNGAQPHPDELDIDDHPRIDFGNISHRDDDDDDDAAAQIRRGTDSNGHAGSGNGNASDSNNDDDGNEPNSNLVQMLMTKPAWFMLWTAVILVGAGTVETNNMDKMVESAGFPKIVAPSALAIFSVAQSAGRVTTGALSEAALNWGVPRPFFMMVASVVALVAHVILAFARSEVAFVLGTALSGYGFGMVWPLLVLIVGEVFGKAHVAANYMFYDGVTSAAGTVLLSKIVAQRVYEAHIDGGDEQDGDGGEQNTCHGLECFALTHVIIAVLSVSCFGTSWLLLRGTRDTYSQRRTSQHTH